MFPGKEKGPAADVVQIIEPGRAGWPQPSAAAFFIHQESLLKIAVRIFPGCGTENALLKVLLHLFSPFPA
jgi:hypothetical protein